MTNTLYLVMDMLAIFTTRAKEEDGRIRSFISSLSTEMDIVSRWFVKT